MTDTLNKQVNVTNVATLLIAKIPSGQEVIVRNRDATNSVYMGGPGVTTGAGLELKAGEQLASSSIDLPPETELWAIAASGSIRIDVLEFVSD